VHAIYVAASARDGRFTRICVASIRHFYPDVPIRLLIGGKLEPGLAAELERNWNVLPAAIPAGEWGWGFVKLEPLFGPPGERFLVLDSDTVFTGPVLDAWATCEADFLVDDEQQSEADTQRLYYDWQRVAAIDPDALPPQFVFNSGQWFGTSGVLRREDFAAFVDWSGMPPRLRHFGIFMPGDQGILNYVLNQKAQLGGLKVARCKIMHWPGHGMNGLTAKAVSKGTVPPLIVHWAGFKGGHLGAFPGEALLRFFEGKYYGRSSGGNLRRVWRGVRHHCHYVRRNISDKIAHRLARSRT